MDTREAVKRRNEAESEIRDILKSLADDFSGTPFGIGSVHAHLNMVDVHSKEERGSKALGDINVNIELTDERFQRHDI